MVKTELIGDQLRGVVEQRAKVADFGGLAGHMHGGAQLIGAALQVLRALGHQLFGVCLQDFQLRHHGVKGDAQMPDFIGGGHLGALIQLAALDVAHRCAQAVDGRRNGTRQKVGESDGECQCRQADPRQLGLKVAQDGGCVGAGGGQIQGLLIGQRRDH